MPAEVESLFVVREPAWHGLGIVLGDYPDFSLVGTGTEGDPIVLAGHNYEVVESPVYIRTERDVEGVITVAFPKLEGFKAIQHSKTDKVFAVTGDSYTVLQNVEGWNLAALLTEHDTNVKVESAGVLREGAIGWILLKVDEPWVAPGDNTPIYPFVNVNWAHDGTGALRIYATDIRTVCANTLDLGTAKAAREQRDFTFRHTKNVSARIEDAKAAISGVREHSRAFQELAEELCQIPVTDEQREQFVTTFIPQPVGEVISDRVVDNIADARAKVRSIFDSPTMPEAHRNTAYGLVNAGVEYLDWLRGARNKETQFGRQLLRQEPLKARLVPLVRELVKA